MPCFKWVLVPAAFAILSGVDEIVLDNKGQSCLWERTEKGDGNLEGQVIENAVQETVRKQWIK